MKKTKKREVSHMTKATKKFIKEISILEELFSHENVDPSFKTKTRVEHGRAVTEIIDSSRGYVVYQGPPQNSDLLSQFYSARRDYEQNGKKIKKLVVDFGNSTLGFYWEAGK